MTNTTKKKTYKLRVKNHTDIPTDLVKEMIRFVTPSNVTGFDVRVSNYGGNAFGRGTAYTHGCSLHDRRCPFVVISVGARKLFPIPPRPPVRKKAGYLPQPWYASREEACLFILAHEIRHLWQRKIKKGHRVWGARGQYSERDTDAYAIRMLREWRRRVVV